MDQLLRKSALERKIVQHLIAGHSANSISKELRVGKKRVSKVKSLAKEAGYLDSTPLPQFPKSLFFYDEPLSNRPSYDTEISQHKEWIEERLNKGWKIISLYEELPHPLKDLNFSYTTFRRALKRLGIRGDHLQGPRVVPEIITAPGEVLQLDWGKVRDVVDPISGKKSTLWAFVGVMGHSRYMMVKLVWTNSVEITLQAIQEMFSELGGTPLRIVSDNPKCFAIEASKYEPILNVAFERFCSHYNVIPELLPPRDPKKKGKVERMMTYVRRLLEGFEGSWSNLAKCQEYLDKKLEMANNRIHGTTRLKPIESLVADELPVLGELPTLAYEVEEYHWGKVRKDGHVRFRNKYYSVDEKHHGEKVFIIGNSSQIEIYLKCQLIETHSRVSGNFQSKSTKEHHRKGWERVMQDCEHYLKKASKIGPSTNELIKQILLNGNGFVDNRKVWGILSLDKDYEKQSIEIACKTALDLESHSYQTVKRLLQNTSKRSFDVKSTTQEKQFIRSTVEYESLIN